MTRVLVLWADSHSPNLGVRALAEGTAALARRVWGDATEVTFQDFGPGATGTPLGGRAVARDLAQRSGPVRRLLADADVVIDTGAGDSFTDIYGAKRLAVMLYVQEKAYHLGVDYMLGPQTIGPFSSPVARHLATRSLRRATFVGTRDSVSASYATLLGRSPDARSTDVAFALPVPVAAKTRDVILNVSGLLWSPGPHVDSSRYQALVTKVHAELSARGRSVSLLAHVLDSRFADNDVPAVTEMCRRLPSGTECLIPRSLQEAREALASAHLVIGSRMHACLNALSVGTPAIALAYSRKFAPLMADLGWQHTYDLRAPGDVTDAILRAASADSLAAEVASVQATARLLLERAVVAMRQARP